MSFEEVFRISPILRYSLGIRSTDSYVSDTSGRMTDTSLGRFRQMKQEHWTNKSESTQMRQKRKENRLAQMKCDCTLNKEHN